MRELRNRRRIRNRSSDVSYLTEFEQKSVVQDYEKSLLYEVFFIFVVTLMLGLGFSGPEMQCKSPLV